MEDSDYVNNKNILSKINKKQRKIFLSSLSDFNLKDLNKSLEQYSTPFDISVNFFDEIKNEILNKKVVDLCCGPGMLGITASLYLPNQITYVDICEKALEVLHENLNKRDEFFLSKKISYENIVNEEVFHGSVDDFFDSYVNLHNITINDINNANLYDLCFVNPPFNTKNTNKNKGNNKNKRNKEKNYKDTEILDKALQISKKVYFFHSSHSKFLLKKYEQNKIKKLSDHKFLLKNTYDFHRKEKTYIDVSIYYMKKIS